MWEIVYLLQVSDAGFPLRVFFGGWIATCHLKPSVVGETRWNSSIFFVSCFMIFPNSFPHGFPMVFPCQNPHPAGRPIRPLAHPRHVQNAQQGIQGFTGIFHVTYDRPIATDVVHAGEGRVDVPDGWIQQNALSNMILMIWYGLNGIMEDDNGIMG